MRALRISGAFVLVAALALGCDQGTPTSPSVEVLGPQLSQHPAGGSPVVWSSLSAGRIHTCGVTTGGQVYCWGANSVFGLGNGILSGSSTVPVAVSGGLRFKSVSAGLFHTCGVTTARRAYCWGANGGQLGNGTMTKSLVPVRVSDPT